MKKIPLQLKRKYIAYCYQFMSEQQPKDFNMIYRAVGALLKGSNFGNEDVVQFEIDPEEFTRLWKGLGKRMETFTTRLHSEMRTAIEPQLFAYIPAPETEPEDPELFASVAYVLQQLQSVDAEVTIANNKWIDEGNALIEA